MRIFPLRGGDEMIRDWVKEIAQVDDIEIEKLLHIAVILYGEFLLFNRDVVCEKEDESVKTLVYINVGTLFSIFMTIL